MLQKLNKYPACVRGSHHTTWYGGVGGVELYYAVQQRAMYIAVGAILQLHT